MIEVPGAVDVAALDESAVDSGVAAHYGDPMREQRLLAETVGLVDRGNRCVLIVTGADRLLLLHNLLTQHLTGLPPWCGTEALLLSPHGHIEEHLVLFDDGAATWLDLEPGHAQAVQDFLIRMRFLMRVEVTDVTSQWAVASLVGPLAPQAAQGLGVAALAPAAVAEVPPAKFGAGSAGAGATSHYPVAALDSGGYARRMPSGLDVIIPRLDLPDLAQRTGSALAGIWAFEAHRVAARRPRLGFDTDHRSLPAEVDWLAPAVHLEKGCYRGQETVARVHHLGRPPRRLVLLHLDGITTDELPVPGTEVATVDGRVVGRVGTAVRHFELGQICLALLKRSVPDDAQLRIGPIAAAIAAE